MDSEEIKEQIEDIGQIYSKLTTILIQLGHEYVKDKPEYFDIIKSLDEKMKILTMYDSLKYLEPSQPEPQCASTPAGTRSGQPQTLEEFIREFEPIIRSPKKTITPVEDSAAAREFKINKRFRERWGDDYEDQPSSFHLQVPKQRSRRVEASVKSILEESLNKQVFSKLESALPAEDDPQDFGQTFEGSQDQPQLSDGSYVIPDSPHDISFMTDNTA